MKDAYLDLQQLNVELVEETQKAVEAAGKITIEIGQKTQTVREEYDQWTHRYTNILEEHWEIKHIDVQTTTDYESKAYAKAEKDLRESIQNMANDRDNAKSWAKGEMARAKAFSEQESTRNKKWIDKQTKLLEAAEEKLDAREKIIDRDDSKVLREQVEKNAVDRRALVDEMRELKLENKRVLSANEAIRERNDILYTDKEELQKDVKGLEDRVEHLGSEVDIKVLKVDDLNTKIRGIAKTNLMTRLFSWKSFVESIYSS